MYLALAVDILVAASTCFLVIRMVRIGRRAWRGIRIAYGANNRIPEDASSESIPVPLTATPKHEALLALGFTRLGEERVRIPTRSTGGIGWVLIGPTNTTVAHLGARHAIFATYFSDRHLEITFHPSGERIRTKNMRTDYREKDVPSAYDAHLAQIADAQQIHDTPSTISSMGQYLDMEVTWRRKTGLRLLRRQLLWDIVAVLATAYTVGIILFIVFSTNWRGMSPIRILPTLRLLSLLVLPVIGFIIAHDFHVVNLARKLLSAK